MNDQYDYAVIGGDLRQVYLVEELAHDSNRICHYGLCGVPERHRCSPASFVAAASSLEEICNASPCILCPIPFSKHGEFLHQSAFDKALPLNLLLSNLKPGQSLFAGCIPKDFRSEAVHMGVHVFDLMSDLPLSYFNTIATAEGAICEAIKQSPINLHQSSCAILGYGKCGKTLAAYLKGMFCHVSVASNQEEECAQASLVTDRAQSLEDFGTCVETFDFIFNTIPSIVITSDLLARMKRTVTIIDIASAPGGVDQKAAKKLGIHALSCPGLPGKYAPSSSARAIKKAIERMLKEDLTCL